MTAAEFEAVYDRTVRPLRAYLLRVAGHGALTDDVLQETYYRYLDLDPAVRDALPARPLLYRMATRILYDHFRHFRREERLTAAWPAPTGSTSPLERHRDVARVFDELEPRQRSLLWLAHVEGFSHAEVAEVLGVKAASVRVLLFRARRELARRLRERGLETR